MVAANIQVTQGSGTRLATSSYTEGGVTVHDEKVIFGENYLASYTVTTDSVSTATANSHLLQIMAGASLKVRIRRVEMFQNVPATTVVLMETRLYRLTTAGTGGSAISAGALDTSDSAAGATVMSLPTAKGTETNVIGMGKPYMVQTLGAGAQLNQPIWVLDFDRLRSKPLIIAAGTANGIAIKNVTAVAAGTVGFNIWLDETTF
jgi:hypothetical protein